MSTPFEPLSVTHIAFDLNLAERLRSIGFPHVLRVSDRFTFGPSREDSAEHVRERSAFLGEDSVQWNDLYSPSVRCEPPICLWISADPVERMNLWRTCSYLDRHGITSDSVVAIEQEWFSSSTPDLDLTELASRAEPFSTSRFAAAVDLWRAFTAPDPRGFADRCAQGAPGFPELSRLWRVISAYFPRRLEDRLLLSRFDALVLQALAAGPRSPLRVFTHDVSRGSDWHEIMTATGDIFLSDRLRRWALYGAAPSLVGTPGPRPDTPMMATIYQLTEQGRRLLEEGMRSVSDAPPFPIGGVTAYHSSSPWAIFPDGRLDRIAE